MAHRASKPATELKRWSQNTDDPYMNDALNAIKHFNLNQEAPNSGHEKLSLQLEQAQKLISGLKRDLGRANKEQRILAIDSEELLIQNETQAHQINKLNGKVRDLEVVVGQLKAQQNQSSHKIKEQLGAYARLVGQTKSDILNSWHEFSLQIEIGISTHPLKDYLAYTDREIKLTQEQMFKVHSHPQVVAQLSAKIRKLHEQRDYLAKIIGASEVELKDLSAKIKSKLHMLEGASSLPPPPPLENSDTTAEVK